MLLGNVFGAVIGQTLYLLKVPLPYLFYIAIACSIPCILISVIVFPGSKDYIVPIDVNPKALALEKQQEESELDGVEILPKKRRKKKVKRLPLKKRIVEFVKGVVQCYTTSFEVVFWSCFVIVSVSVHHLAVTYYQTLFRALDEVHVFNGFLIAVAYLFAGLLSLVPSHFERFIERFGTIFCVVVSALSGGCLIAVSFRMHIGFAYGIFIVYHCMFEVLLVIAMSQIAKNMKVSRFAAIFSVNACLQNLAQVLIQFIVGKRVLKLGALSQYRAFGLVMLLSTVISILLIIARIGYNYLRRTRSNSYPITVN
jgi:hypothetical protein